MSRAKSGSTLRTLVLTPERIPDFFIPSRSPLRYLSPRIHRRSPVRVRLLSDHDDDGAGESPPGAPLGPAARGGFLLCVPSPQVRPAPAAEHAGADTDLTTRAAMSLPHVEKVTTPYGFRAVLAASPCTRRRESLFHKPVTVQVTAEPADPPGPSRSPAVNLRPAKALGLQVMKELRRSAAALKILITNAKTPRR